MSLPRRAAVLGRPIAHSLSPVLHRAAYDALGLAWRYDAIECGADELAAVLRERADWAGFSCTMPLKHAVLQVADEVRPLAWAVGAANTLLPLGGGRWAADNTDVSGVVQALTERAVQFDTVTVLGAGGTAQAVLAALDQLAVGSCTVLVRDAARATPLLATAERVGVGVSLSAISSDAAGLRADLVVSTLPPGAADALAAAPWSARQTVFDVVYDPWPSKLAGAARAGGATVLSGAPMLLHQAVRQVELMTGLPAPVDTMRAALRRATAAI